MSTIQKWFKDRIIFITGASGFMGKVLLEKLLRDVPDAKQVILLVRPKRGVLVDKRIEEMRNLPMFERLRQMRPTAFDKVLVIAGCLDQPNLGLSASDRMKLADVSVVYHLAATLKLEADIKDAVSTNTLGTLEVLKLCKTLVKMECFVHASTAFCYPDKDLLDEKLYEPHCDPYEIMKFVQLGDEVILQKKKLEILGPHPNSYTFSKRLAEWVVKDFATDFRVAIARPSIVIPCLKEPIPGWVDSLNGPIGVIAAAGKGVLRSMLCVESNTAQTIPCDLAINALITIPTSSVGVHRDEAIVYHLNLPENMLRMTWGELLTNGQKIIAKYPFEWMLWYPAGAIRTNVYVHWMVILLFQWIPALFLDLILFLIGRKRFMVHLQKKIRTGLEVLQYFTMRQWRFDTKQYEAMSYALKGCDEEIFYNLNITYDLNDYLTAALLITKKHLFKENLANIPYLRIYLKVLFALHQCVKYALLYFLISRSLHLIGMQHLLSTSYWFKVGN